MKQTNCRSCDAPVFWAKSRNDKNMLMDLEPASPGKFIINGIESDNPLALRISGNTEYAGDKYDCHWDNCEKREPRD